MITDTRFQLPLTGTNSADGVAVLAVPYRCTVRDVRPVAQAAASTIASSAISMTVVNGSTTIGNVSVAAASGSMAAGAVGTYTPVASSSAGNTVLAKDAVITITAATAAGSDASTFVVDVELDPYARSL